jgi:urease gamma subunit
MALPKIDAPVYELDLPLSKKHIRYRPFLVKEQRNLLMAIESDERETIEKNVRQVLHNCTLTEDINIDKLPITDVEFYFLNLRARSVGEIVRNKYRCENVVDGKTCNNLMESNLNILDITVDMNGVGDGVIQLTNEISMKLNYPEFEVLTNINTNSSSTDIAFGMIVECIEYIFDGEQYFYARETTKEELVQFIESLNTEQFAKIEDFFTNMPRLNKKIDMTCSKCGFHHTIEVEGLEDFFG